MIALMADTLSQRGITLADESDMQEDNGELIKLSASPAHDLLDLPATPYTRQSKGERKRNKRNRWR